MEGHAYYNLRHITQFDKQKILFGKEFIYKMGGFSTREELIARRFMIRTTRRSTFGMSRSSDEPSRGESSHCARDTTRLQ